MTDRCDCGSKVGEPHLPACHYTGIVTAISRYNVADMMGNLIPDDVVAGVTVNPSYSQLRQALEDIRQMTVGTGDDPGNQFAALCRIYTRATEALVRRPYSHE